MNLKYSLILFLFLLLPFAGMSQRSATATFMATVTIIEPVQIENTGDMNFASIDARQGGTVTLNPDNTRSASGDVLLNDASGVSAASFTIQGQSGYSYNIVLPKNEIIMSNGESSITLKDFTADYQGLFDENIETVRLGASLDIKAGQQPGNYRSISPIEVTVSYN